MRNTLPSFVMPAHDHVYVHVPFCEAKCAYCAFYSVRYDAGLADRYLDALERETALHVERHGLLRPATVYVGGGTPTVLSGARLERLLHTVLRRSDPSRLREWTVEVNPGTLTRDKLDALVRAGVNRVSVGAQTFEDASLAAVGRRHRAADTRRTVAALRAAGIDNVGLDLIAGLPHAEAASWRRDLEAALRLAPRHVSVYPLAVESGTGLHRRWLRGAHEAAGPETELARLRAAERLLAGAGLHRYEVSNFARPGRACAHNLACWRGRDYIGFGPAAATRRGRARWTNRADVAAYAAAPPGRPPPREAETLDEEVDLAERLVFSFRVVSGVDLAAFAARHGAAPARYETWTATLRRLERQGLVRRRGDRWRATSRGLDVCDVLAAEVWAG